MIKKITIPRYSIEALIKLLEINGKNSKLAAKTALENLLQASENEETLEPEYDFKYEDFLYNRIKEKRDNAQWDYDMTSEFAPQCRPIDLFVLKGQIDAYNDVLALIESIREQWKKIKNI